MTSTFFALSRRYFVKQAKTNTIMIEENFGQLVLIQFGGSNLDLWISRLKGFNSLEFYLMDSSIRPHEPPKYRAIAEELTERDNCTVWIRAKRKPLRSMQAHAPDFQHQ